MSKIKFNDQKKYISKSHINNVCALYGSTVGAVTIDKILHQENAFGDGSKNGAVISKINSNYDLNKGHTIAELREQTSSFICLIILINFTKKRKMYV